MKICRSTISFRRKWSRPRLQSKLEPRPRGRMKVVRHVPPRLRALPDRTAWPETLLHAEVDTCGAGSGSSCVERQQYHERAAPRAAGLVCAGADHDVAERHE